MAGSTTARQACNVQACTAQPAPAAPLPGSGEALPPRLCCSHTGCHERCREHCRDAHCPTTSMPAAALGTCVVGPAAAVLLAAPLPRLEEWPTAFAASPQQPSWPPGRPGQRGQSPGQQQTARPRRQPARRGRGRRGRRQRGGGGRGAIGPRATRIVAWHAAGAGCEGARPGSRPPCVVGAGSSGLVKPPGPPLRTFCSAFTACTRTACTRAGRLALLRCTPLRRPQGLVTSAVCMMLLLGDPRAAGRTPRGRWRPTSGSSSAELAGVVHGLQAPCGLCTLDRSFSGAAVRVWIAAPPSRPAPGLRPPARRPPRPVLAQRGSETAY